jgi:hypothetical protein
VSPVRAPERCPQFVKRLTIAMPQKERRNLNG